MLLALPVTYCKSINTELHILSHICRCVMMINEAAQTSSSAISDEQFRMLMDEIKKNRGDVNQRLDKLEGDVASEQENAAKTVVQKLKADRSYTIRKQVDVLPSKNQALCQLNYCK